MAFDEDLKSGAAGTAKQIRLPVAGFLTGIDFLRAFVNRNAMRDKAFSQGTGAMGANLQMSAKEMTMDPVSFRSNPAVDAGVADQRHVGMMLMAAGDDLWRPTLLEPTDDESAQARRMTKFEGAAVGGSLTLAGGMVGIRGPITVGTLVSLEFPGQGTVRASEPEGHLPDGVPTVDHDGYFVALITA
jgi:hypothetical protein